MAALHMFLVSLQLLIRCYAAVEHNADLPPQGRVSVACPISSVFGVINSFIGEFAS